MLLHMKCLDFCYAEFVKIINTTYYKKMKKVVFQIVQPIILAMMMIKCVINAIKYLNYYLIKV